MMSYQNSSDLPFCGLLKGVCYFLLCINLSVTAEQNHVAINTSNATTSTTSNTASISNISSTNSTADLYEKGLAYLEGNNIERNFTKALFLFEKAAEQNHADAANQIGQMYALGYGVEINYKTAEKWLRQGAELGSYEACFSLGALYIHGKIDGTANLPQANTWFEKAAKSEWPDMLYSIGTVFDDDEARQPELAVIWYKKAAEKGHSLAMLSWGLLAESGEGMEQNRELALNLYHQAAEKGEAIAAYFLALAYEQETNTLNMAAQWMQKAATAGLPAAAYALSIMYKEGRGLEQNKEQSYFWLLKAAEAGYPEALQAIH